ncbi:MAG: HlyD family efflux transporter periplasmic adaptor subunit [Nitrospirae bacterium]|nr:HlyD family efflux transporter periplasmic adaptor subunit [Nitrospirota bacterium]
MFHRSTAGVLVVVLAGLFIFTACSRPDPDRTQGYIEGEFVYVSSPFGGTLKTLHVRQGQQARAGDILFTLESVSEKAARDEAQWRLKQARENLKDAQKGKRSSEIEAFEAQLKQAEAALSLSEKELGRQEGLFLSGLIAAQDIDRARSAYDQDRQRVAQLKADIKTAHLGLRSDQIAAAKANVQALEAALAGAEWDLLQKRQAAPQSGLVFDTLFREGEFVPAGRPVVTLLPAGNIKVRAFVPQTRLSAIHTGDKVRVFVDGSQGPSIGTISFISPRAEYTPPVIYSKEGRSKLVFMIEAVFAPETAVNLHPGQPVDIQFGE